MNKQKLKFLGWGLVGFTLLGILLILGFYLLIVWGFFGSLPNKEELSDIQHYEASEVYSKDGKLLGKYFVENRTNVKYEELPKHLINALVATEDARFYKHKGIDRQSLLRVLVKSILLGDKSAGGGSTLSQQLAKNLFPRQRYGVVTMLVNKVKEAVLASRIEELYTKEQVITLYFNTVPFGEDVYGIGVASQRFFSCDPIDLTVPQAATLVGILKANTAYNPRINPKRSKQRRNVVLKQMKKYGYLTKKECSKYQNSLFKIEYKRITKHDGLAPYFREYLRKELIQYLDNNLKPNGERYDLYRDGLKIYTTIDSRLQKKAEKAVQLHINRLQLALRKQLKGNNYQQLNKICKQLKKGNYNDQKRIAMTIWNFGQEVDTMMTQKDSAIHYISTLQTGLLSLSPKTGEIKAWVGGIAHKYFEYDHVTAPRQVGSTFKPIVYANALEQKISPCKLFKNEHITYSEYDDWSPKNSGNRYDGYYTMKGALTKSINTITAKMILKGGIENTINLAKNMEITAKLPKNPTIALGTASIPLFQMLGAYTSFANHGQYSKPIYVTRIEDKNHHHIFKVEQYHKQVIDSTHADMITEMLQSVVDSGTARRLRSTYKFKNTISGKTGTTQNNVDGWFIGYTPELLTGVWVGCDNPSIHFSSTKIGQGANTALPIWARYMKAIEKEKELKNLCLSNEETHYLDNCPLYQQYLLSPIFSALIPERELKKNTRKKRKNTKNSSLITHRKRVSIPSYRKKYKNILKRRRRKKRRRK